MRSRAGMWSLRLEAVASLILGATLVLPLAAALEYEVRGHSTLSLTDVLGLSVLLMVGALVLVVSSLPLAPHPALRTST